MSLQLDQLSLALDGVAFIRAFSLAVEAGEIVTLMGPSGSGKSSILQAIAGGLAAPFSATGRVLVDGVEVTHMTPAKRHIGRLFQDDLLFPHLTVAENMLFGMARGARATRLEKVQKALSEIELSGFEDRPPATLSGGQRQRVSLMRSLLAAPHCMLLDEPFSKLDENLRAAMRALTFKELLASKTPALLVTHDKADAPPQGRIYEIQNGEVIHVR